ncbi:transcription repressor NadR [Lactiplantibacillus garii]|uniref:Transcription repressor NadR n=1 Tax=Lactiplantibacillus garii TaxID=2306423 RepID=A0A426D6A6_9LACO|nr:transcription repressor NadR [Lactiplantibacillus garii]RRK10108.1 transcription repressor NadR [Lactiplantibacillus garii]
MTGSERRDQIRAALSTSTDALSATTLAHQLGVSRQTVVGDISLLRANGLRIVATLHGYELATADQPTAIVVCRHGAAAALDEMTRIIQAGGVIKDVTVEHPLYGRLRGELELRTVGDVHLFMGRLKKQHGHLLSELTDGIHTHTIGYQTAAQLTAIQATLRTAGYLYEN